MPNSYAETTHQKCPQCGETFGVEIWLIVDIVERADLLERIRQENLHEITCPKCGPLGQVDAPLLVFRPNDDPAMLFSPVQKNTQEKDEQQVRGLIEQLRRSLGDQWQDAWVANGFPRVQRPMLSATLSNDSEAAQVPENLTTVLQELSQPARRSNMPRRIA